MKTDAEDEVVRVRRKRVAEQTLALAP